ncbi:MAG: hypothetical protein KTR30_29010 [Saprospiraceae bacterium]|nr:hypothetical protein [Saprospiraceae bacterium]
MAKLVSMAHPDLSWSEIKKDSYNNEGGVPVDTLLNDFTLSFEYCGCEVSHLHVFYGAMHESSERVIVNNAKAYVDACLDQEALVCS